MFRFRCIMFWIVMGVKFQVIGRSNASVIEARRVAFTKLDELLEEATIPEDAVIDREGLEMYDGMKPVLQEFWINPQAKSPYRPY